MFVFPGKVLGVEEEFGSGEGTYSEGGVVYALNAGNVEIGRDRVVRVRAQTVPETIKVRSVVLGRVEDIIEPISLVKIEPLSDAGRRQAPLAYFAVLHISRIKMGYVKSIRDEVRIGDIIKARVEEIRRGEVYLSTKENGMGVVKAFCSLCRAPLELSSGELLCRSCGSKERRKLASP